MARLVAWDFQDEVEDEGFRILVHYFKKLNQDPKVQFSFLVGSGYSTFKPISTPITQSDVTVLYNELVSPRHKLTSLNASALISLLLRKLVEMSRTEVCFTPNFIDEGDFVEPHTTVLEDNQ